MLVNPTDQFDEQHFSTSVTIGKRLDNYNTISGFLEYDRVDITDYFPYPTVSPDGIDKFFTLGANFTHDTRDLAEYSANGSLVRGGITKYGFPGKKLDNIRYSFDVRGFVPLADGVVSASRVAGNLMAGSQSPSYNHVYIGYDYRVRGHIGETTEGESMFGTSTELRFNIIQPRYFRANFLPKAFGIWRFALEFAVFGDAAVTWFRKDPAALNNFLAGYGAGFDFLLPYSLVIRTEYARNESSRGQFILDLGGAF